MPLTVYTKCSKKKSKTKIKNAERHFTYSDIQIHIDRL